MNSLRLIRKRSPIMDRTIIKIIKLRGCFLMIYASGETMKPTSARIG
jgi:hypothetical protein